MIMVDGWTGFLKERVMLAIPVKEVLNILLISCPFILHVVRFLSCFHVSLISLLIYIRRMPHIVVSCKT